MVWAPWHPASHPAGRPAPVTRALLLPGIVPGQRPDAEVFTAPLRFGVNSRSGPYVEGVLRQSAVNGDPRWVIDGWQQLVSPPSPCSPRRAEARVRAALAVLGGLAVALAAVARGPRRPPPKR